MAINSLSASSHGLSGLISGMDTQQMVDAMLKGTQTKIDKQNQKKTQLGYKQEMYQSIIAKIGNLRDTFFSMAGSSKSTSLISSSFFEMMSSVTKSNAFKVSPGSDARTGKVQVDYIKQLAKSLSKKSQSKAAGALEGDFDVTSLNKALAAAKGSVTVKVGDKSVDIADLTLLLKGADGKTITDNTKIAEILNRTLNDSSDPDKNLGVEVSYVNGSFTFKTTPGRDANGKEIPTPISITGNAAGMKVFGAKSSVGSEKGALTTKMDISAVMPSITAVLDGVSKKITFDPNAVTNARTLTDSLNESLKKAFGDKVTAVTDGSTKIRFTADDSSQLTIQGGTDEMKMLGIKSGQSTKISEGLALNTLNFATPLMGSNFRFNINGVGFNFTDDRALSDVIAEINNSEAGVRITYSRTEDKYSIESKVMGGGTEISMSQSEGNLLTALFGTKSGDTVRGGKLQSHVDITGSEGLTLPADFKSGTVKLMINDREYTVTLPKLKDADGKETDAVYDNDTFVAELNKQLEKLAGKNSEDKANISVSLAGGNITLHSERGYNVALTDPATLTMFGINTDAGDVTKTTTDANAATSLKDLGYENGFSFSIGGGVMVQVAPDETVQDVLDKMNQGMQAAGSTTGRAEFEESSGRFRIFGVDIPMEIHIYGDEDAKLFGGETLNFTMTDAATTDTAGQDAILSVNGNEIKRNSNAFSYEGINFELVSAFDGKPKLDDAGNPVLGADGKPVYTEAASIETTRDDDQIFNGITKFVEEYNKLLESIQELTSAKPTYKDYPPLTGAQKEAMSDREVELWEEKSKVGLLRGDAALEKVMADMRSMLYTKPESSDLALYGIGITTEFDFSTSQTGKLKIDDEKLRKAISQNPDGVKTLFAASDGFATKFKDVLNDAALNSSASPGSLVRIAGKNDFDTSSRIYKDIKEIDVSLKSLERKYKTEYNRYWKQYNAMEQMIQNMNSQSSWLSQQLGGS